ncbi:glycosyl hydrolase family 28-related protein [Chryseobacterium tructae]|uniref:Glycosyl hydrolase family 28-related protein n=1 Tax=Chryseobacterium tructae TaxID=1037380 RepID=A0ABV7XQS2_9FLAO|nr:glycosyl hydrolase family 28-related protein [Chryseobacterium tructae]MDN3695685.1 glycosyl hydrolase family 28-related protein [Chryseobacterium tructae]
MIFTEDFFSPTSVYPSEDLVQLVDSFTKENVNYQKYTGSATVTDDGVVYRKKGNDFYVDINFLTSGQLNIQRFGAKGDDLTDNSIAIKKALAFCENYRKERIIPENGAVYRQFDKAIIIYFPNGIYRYTDIGNIKIENLTIKGETFRGVVLKCMKGGIALEMDAFKDNNDSPPFCKNLNLNNIVVEGQYNTEVLIFAQGIAHSNWENVAVREADKDLGIGFHFKGVMLSGFKNLQCSSDVDTVMNTGNKNIPYQGLKLDHGHRIEKEKKIKDGKEVIEEVLKGIGNCSNNSFYDIKMEGMPFGVNIFQGDQNTFYGGTPESCTKYGLMVSRGSRYNTFIGSAFENDYSIADVLDDGIHTVYINCYASKKAWFQGQGATVLGGFWQEVQIDNSAEATKIENVTIKYFTLPSAGIIDNGKMTTIQNVKDDVLGAYIPNKYNATIHVGSAQRPENNSVGSMIFDTDLLKPIWFNGNSWVDASGAIV